jgi:hypothetical protein
MSNLHVTGIDRIVPLGNPVHGDQSAHAPIIPIASSIWQSLGGNDGTLANWFSMSICIRGYMVHRQYYPQRHSMRRQSCTWQAKKQPVVESKKRSPRLENSVFFCFIQGNQRATTWDKTKNVFCLQCCMRWSTMQKRGLASPWHPLSKGRLTSPFGNPCTKGTTACPLGTPGQDYAGHAIRKKVSLPGLFPKCNLLYCIMFWPSVYTLEGMYLRRNFQEMTFRCRKQGDNDDDHSD